MDINELIIEGKSFYFIEGEFSNHINDAPNYAKWKEKCKRFLNLNFKNDKYIENFEKNCAVYDNSHTQNELIGILEAFRDMPSIIQKPTSRSKGVPDTVVNVHQNQKQVQEQEQTQSQEIALNIFLESIKDELTGKQFKELQTIVSEEQEPEKAKSKVIEKLKSFGENVLTNIVANVITNPTIWGGLM